MSSQLASYHSTARFIAVAVSVAALVLLVLGPPFAQAGTATLEAATPRFSDPAGVPDDLEVAIHDFGAANGGWATSFFDLGNPPVGGAGCVDEFASVCRTGTAAPTAVGVDVAGGNDRVVLSTAPALPSLRVTVSGGPGDDEINAYQTVVTVDAGEGNDHLAPEYVSFASGPPQPSPDDVWSGGAGEDTVDYTAAVFPIDVSLDDIANDGRAGDGDNVRSDIENVTASPAGGTILGSAAPNVLTGRGGDDRLVGGAGRDTLDAQGGNDTLDALDGSGGDRVDCGEGADTALADGADVLAGCEAVVWAPAVASSKLSYRSKRISVKLKCPKASTATCKGNVRLTARSGKKLAAASYRIKRGKAATVRLKARKKPGRKATLYLAPKGTNPIAGHPVTVR
jgi:Ca2+-binding RTX toxin-like protein